MTCRQDDERGSALVEFQVLAVLLLVPLVYVMLTALDVQRTVFGATQAAREAGRVAATTGDEAAARYAARLAMSDQGIDSGDVRVSFGCPQGCRTPGGEIRVDVATVVRLPFLPPVLTDTVRAQLPVSATHVAPIDRYRAALP